MSKLSAFRSSVKQTPPSSRTVEKQIELLNNKEPLKLNRAERRFKEQFERRNKK